MDRMVAPLGRLWRAIADRLAAPADGAEAAALHDVAAASAPVLWLLGKTGAGKTSIVAALTGDPAAEVGAGFAPCTRTARVFDLPPEAPLLRILDTRGLEEPGYDPAEDIAWCESQAHLIVAVARVDDPAQGAVLAALRAARRRHPDWPVIVAQTHLHALYPAGAAHPDPYPFTGGPDDLLNPAIPHALRQALAHHRALFEGLPGPAPRFVPLDFTDAADGYEPTGFGLDALLAALAEAAPEAARAIAAAREAPDGTRRLILGYAAAAAGGGAVPAPAIGIAALAGANGLMLRALAARHGLAWTSADLAGLGAAIGGGALLGWGLRYGVRELAKLIPGLGTVLGGTLNAAAAFALTCGIGEAARVWLAHRRRGATAPPEEVRRAFHDALAQAVRRNRPA